MAERKLITLENLEVFATELKSKYTKQADYETLNEKVQSLEEAHGEKNKIEIIKVNGSVSPISPDDRSVDISVPKAVSELNNDRKFQTDKEVADAIAAKVSSVYKPGGSVTASKFADAPTEEDECKLYNASEPFDTNENFLETEVHHYPAGTNVGAVKQEDGSFKWDAMAGFVDLSDYAKTEDMNTAIGEAVDGLSIGDYAKTSEMETYVTSQLGNYYDKTTMDDKLGGYVKTSDISDVVRNDGLATTLTAYVKNSDIKEITETEIKALLA